MEPADLFIGAEPGELPLGKMTCVTLHKGDCFIERDPAPEIKPDLAVADALKRRKIQPIAARKSRYTPMMPRSSLGTRDDTCASGRSNSAKAAGKLMRGAGGGQADWGGKGREAPRKTAARAGADAALPAR